MSGKFYPESQIVRDHHNPHLGDSTRHAEFVAAVDGEAFFCGHFYGAFGAVVVLQCSAAVGRSVGWAAVMGHAVPEEAAAGVEGNGDVSGDGDVGVAYLPVASPEMRDGSFAMGAGDDVQASVFFCGGVNGDPYADDGGADGIVEVRAVLMPGFFAAYVRGFDQSHILKEYGGVVHHAGEDGEDIWVVGEVVEPGVVIDEFPDFTHAVAARFACEFGKVSAFGSFGHYAFEVLALAVDEIPHGLARGFDLLRCECPLNGEVSLFVKSGDLMIVNVGEGVEIVCPSGCFVEGWVVYRDGCFGGCHDRLLKKLRIEN